MKKAFKTNNLSLSAWLNHLHQVYHQYQQVSLTDQIDHLQASPSHNKAETKYFINSISVLQQLYIGRKTINY